ncbi:hypothetical protein BHE18_18495 [Rossellomorea aquimaris]|uniref:Uncharacterized protein n=1 Tax=Rossellomorea aquimaris TaxID=189382 RepID=A0A1J6W562_9BACI|nr:hypothetical protein BHE18_18495 [Rossellomorea aquimaris]
MLCFGLRRGWIYGIWTEIGVGCMGDMDLSTKNRGLPTIIWIYQQKFRFTNKNHALTGNSSKIDIIHARFIEGQCYLPAD